jgi:hypothetical protein
MPVQPDPQTTNLGYFIPLNGADVGTWDEPMNANYAAIDNTFSTVSSISLAGGNNITLSTPIDDSSSWVPTQSQSALLRFSGILPNNVSVTLPRPGFWLVENLCTNTANFVVFLKSTSTSPSAKVVCAPPGEMVHVFCDGLDCKFVAMGRIGGLMDYAGSALPAWMTQCTVPPYVNCDGSTVNATLYPVLAGMMTNLPDIRGRGRVSLNQGTKNYLKANGGVDGDTIFSTGGGDTVMIIQANLPNVSFPVTDKGHFHYLPNAVMVDQVGYGPPGGQLGTTVQSGSLNLTQPAVTGITVKSGGSGKAFTNVSPIIVSGLTLIRAG